MPKVLWSEMKLYVADQSTVAVSELKTTRPSIWRIQCEWSRGALHRRDGGFVREIPRTNFELDPRGVCHQTGTIAPDVAAKKIPVRMRVKPRLRCGGGQNRMTEPVPRARRNSDEVEPGDGDDQRIYHHRRKTPKPKEPTSWTATPAHGVSAGATTNGATHMRAARGLPKATRVLVARTRQRQRCDKAFICGGTIACTWRRGSGGTVAAYGINPDSISLVLLRR